MEEEGFWVAAPEEGCFGRRGTEGRRRRRRPSGVKEGRGVKEEEGSSNVEEEERRRGKGFLKRRDGSERN